MWFTPLLQLRFALHEHVATDHALSPPSMCDRLAVDHDATICGRGCRRSTSTSGVLLAVGDASM
jgi:hypothetical protein